MTDDTGMRLARQHVDRWTNYVDNPGILEISERLTIDELRRFDLFSDYDDAFLERISPDVTVATWEAGSVLFEEGSYLDLAFFVSKGTVDVFVSAIGEAGRPIFDAMRTGSFEAPDPGSPPPPTADTSGRTVFAGAGSGSGLTSSKITLLSVMDFDLPHGESRRLGAGELLGEIGALSGWPHFLW